MKRSFFFILFLSLYCLPLYSQIITVNDFVAITSLSDKRLTSYMSKMSFAAVGRSMDDGTIINEYFYRNKKQPYDTTLRFLSGYKKGKITGVAYQTSSFSEYQAILREFHLNGFIAGGKQDTTLKADTLLRVDTATLMDSTIIMDSTAKVDTTSFFQKGEMTVRIGEDMRDEVRVFRIILEKKPVPSSSAVRFADDLLLFDSHQALTAMFGQSNVKKDHYYFTEQDSLQCSVIFPNTNRQVVFLWEDQENFRTLSFLIVGGTLHAGVEPDANQSVALNIWRSTSGLFTGMRISEVLRINEGDFNFFGNPSEFAMMAVPEKKGNIDFKLTGATFGCLNCAGNPMMRKEKISAQGAINAGLQLYITSLILMPER